MNIVILIYRAENINEHPIYLSDFTSAIEEIEQYISNVRSFRKCYLSKLDICDDGLEPIDRLRQLGCDHFFHKCCLSHYLKCEIDKAKMEPTEPLMCIECQNEHHCCGCMTCSGVLRKDTENRGHIITEQEVSTLVACPSANFSEVNKDHWDRHSKYFPPISTTFCYTPVCL